MRLSTRTLILLALAASLISFIKFQPCANIGWAQPGTDIHACYTDIPALFFERGLDSHKWPYSGVEEQAVEYPALQAVVMWGVTYLSGESVRSYYHFNVLLIIFLFIATVFLVKKISPDKSYLYAIAPTGIAAMFINWDMWAIISMLAAIYWFDRKRYELSAIALAVSIATKFFPIVLIIPALIILWRRSEIQNLFRYAIITTVTWIAINLPFALAEPKGWWRFFEMNLHRNPDWGSFWLALRFMKIPLSDFNFLTTAVVLLLLLVAAFYLLNTEKVLSLATSSIFFIAIIMTFGKVYSPQYVLWLAPLVVIAMKERELTSYFWGWQITEIIYHIAIWEYLAGEGQDKHLLPQNFYVIAILIRIAGIVAVCLALARQHRMGSNFPREFLEKSAEIYP